MSDICAENWMDLHKVLYDLPPNEDTHRRYRSNYVYRGMADSSWGLETSLYRMGSAFESVEGPLLRSFKKYAETGSIPGESLWIRLSVAQHHGLPTRLLDWTLAPKVALHFATAEENFYDKDAAIWRINILEVKKLLPDKLKEVLDNSCADLFSVEMLEDNIRTLNKLDTWRPDEPFILFFEPPSLDARIINQGAILSVMSDAKLILSEFLKEHSTLYDRIIIPKELKWEIRDKLDQDNVTERMLFPGLDGLSRWLKRYYGPGPNA
ncbi:MAG: FRG domain-containing protein [Methylobacter sp.]|uniref:FRG domain-containing protein n=1 Tax=Methylobacter sp. TaxID=2051955 RepID=UPI0025E3954E|nr:FRG domain-containing protein [Methylobacter sp.]MCK9621118.1 FRG domain-containing protein [Methylobacter sp.]